MTINFALSLSYAGIDLLQRVGDGWRRVGTASLLSADLAADLAQLRAKGVALAPDGLKTKIVIPSEQIRYLILATTQTTRADIHAALDGATPYGTDELAIDFERRDGFTHIAAVARETLKEAEDFAFAHGFNPVSFVAVPEPDTFRHEIFFGPTSRAASLLGPQDVVERDSLPVLLTGTRIKAQVLLADTSADVVTPAVTLPYLDLVIGEYHAAPAQIEVPLIAVPLAGSQHPVVLGGVVEPFVPPVAPARAAYVMPAAIAASVALLSVFLWGQYNPDTTGLAPAADATGISIAMPDQTGGATALPGDDAGVATAAAPVPLTRDTADTPPPAQPAAIGQVLTPDQASAAYEATGVWQRAPRFADLPDIASTENVDWPVSIAAPARMDLPVLPPVQDLSTDLSFVPLQAPPVAGQTFDLDENGFVRATAEGAITPDGAIVYDGLPDLPFMARPDTIVPASETATPEPDAGAEEPADAAPESVAVIDGPPPVVPPLRPDVPATIDTGLDATAGGVALTSLVPERDTAETGTIAALTPPAGAIRPQARPDLPQAETNADEVAAVLGGISFAEPDPLASATALAVATSIRPATRPADLAARAAAVQQPAPEPDPAPAVVAAAPVPPPAAAPAPAAAAPVAPQNYAPVPGGVARAATQENAIRLRDMNLIGVYGQANARRALVRLGNGQYVRVQVGSELDGGQVTAIGDNALNFVRRGTTYALQIPSG